MKRERRFDEALEAARRAEAALEAAIEKGEDATKAAAFYELGVLYELVYHRLSEAADFYELAASLEPQRSAARKRHQALKYHQQ